MNWLLLEEQQMLDDTRARVTGRQLQHTLETLGSEIGSELKVGRLNGRRGRAEIVSLDAHAMELHITWLSEPPPTLPCTLILALPRPKMLKRTLQTCATMGIKNIYLINAWKVEKSFWQSPWLTDEKIHENLVLGLEQTGDTILPSVHLRKLFKPFVEDELPDIVQSGPAFLAHPGATNACPVAHNAPCTLAVGPEGGFTPYEAGKLMEAGFDAVSLGPRILRVETAVPALLGRMYTG